METPQETLELTLIDDVEWASSNEDEDRFGTGELAPRPKYEIPDICGCASSSLSSAEPTCTDESCVLFACQEECPSKCGPHCGNQRIARKQGRRVEVIDAGKKGKGLRLLEDVKKGDFIIEYVGRAIKKAYLDRLFKRYRNERMLYIMALDNDIYIDARKKGGLARYINHSCEPNAQVQRWKVRGVLRAGVFALRDIPAGEELTFDYQWKLKRGRAPTKCYCLTPSCRGTLEMPKSIEQDELERQLSSHWKRPTSSRAGREIVNRSIKIMSNEHHEYFFADVCKYDDSNGQHLVIYRNDWEEVWEDLSKEDWMILDEEAEQFVIGKKRLATADKGASLLGNMDNAEQLRANKAHIYVQTPIKEEFLSRNLIDRCQQNCHVTIAIEEIKKPTGVPSPISPDEEDALEKQKALEASKDGIVWKLTVSGFSPSKALMVLEKNVGFIERQLQPAARAPSPGSGVEELIIPRCIVDIVKRKLPLIRDKCRSVNVTFAHSESKSKQFSKLVLEGLLASDVENAKEVVWTQLVSICIEGDAPMAPSGIHKDLGFLGGHLTSDEFRLILGEGKDSGKQQYSEDLRRSTFVSSFESTQRCTVWVQSEEDMGRIDPRSNQLVGAASPNAPRKVYFGAAPKEVPKLWTLVKVRAAELAQGVTYLHLGADRIYQPFMLRNGNQFFDFIGRICGVSVTVDPMTGDHLRIDGKTSDPPSLNGSPWPENGRVAVAEELIRLQVELYRDHCIRQQNWIFGRDWSLVKPSTETKPDTTQKSAAVARGASTSASRNHFDARAIAGVCPELTEIVSNLQLNGDVAAHTVVIMYRFSNMVADEDELNFQMKTRDFLLGSLFIANKAQKVFKWKRLDALLEAAYKVFYPGSQFDRKSEEVLMQEKRVLGAETEILETLDYDVSWRGVEWLLPAATHVVAEPLAKNALELAISAPVLAAGPTLWLKYGIDYIFAAVAGFLSIDLEKLCPALSLVPLKVSQSAEIIAESVTANGASRKGHSSSIFGSKEALLKQVPAIREACIRAMSKVGGPADPRRASEESIRYQVIGSGARKRRVYQGLASDVVKDQVLPIIDGVGAESKCRILIGANAARGLEDVVLEGNWRALAIAEFFIKSIVDDAEGQFSLPAPIDQPMNEDSSANVQAKLDPGFMSMVGVDTADGWDGTVQSKVLDDSSSLGRKVGGKACIPGKIEESSVREAGLRWWIPPRYGPSPTGSICDMFCIRRFDTNPENRGTHLEELAVLAGNLMGPPVAAKSFPSLMTLSSQDTEGPDNRCVAVSLQRWPAEKVANREQKISKAGAEVGFSPAALQEMQLLTQLHSLVPSPLGHPNFMLPVAVAVPEDADQEETKSETSPEAGTIGSDADIFSLFRTSEENERDAEKEKKRKDIVTGPHLIFHPTPFIMQKFTSRSIRRMGADSSGDGVTALTPTILQAWFHDLLSALVHCHTNHVVIRTLQADQIVIDHSGVAKLGSFYRSQVIPPDERRKSPHPLKSAKARKGDKHDDEETNSAYIAPEILLGSPKHTKETDVWSMGCLMAHLLLSKPLFVGKDRGSLLAAIFKIVGTPSKDNFPYAEKFPFYQKLSKKYKRGVQKALKYMMGDEESEKHALALDLLDQMLHLDPKKRITAVEALKHEYMAQYIENCNSEAFQQQFVYDWLALKQKLMQSSKSANQEALAREKEKKRKTMILAASSTADQEDDDGLYDLDDLLGGGSDTKKQRTD